MADIKRLSTDKIDSCLNSYREVFSDPLKSGDDNSFNSGVILPLDFSLEMDGLSGIIPHSAFVIPSDSLPKSYLIQSGSDKGKQKIAFILHTIEQNFGSNKWTTKITGQVLNIRFEPLTEEEKKQIQAAKDKQKSLSDYKNFGNKNLGKGYDYIISKYGEISSVISENSGEGLIDKSLLTTLTFPYPMYFNGKLTKTTSVHKLVKDDLLAIFNEILNTFGLEKIKKLGLDQFSGAYFPRLKRGGSTPSIHSWGIAIDINAGKNSLNMKTGTALFSKPEYKEFIDIWYKHNFKSFGRELGYDWMHFQVKDAIF